MKILFTVRSSDTNQQIVGVGTLVKGKITLQRGHQTPHFVDYKTYKKFDPKIYPGGLPEYTTPERF